MSSAQLDLAVQCCVWGPWRGSKQEGPTDSPSYRVAHCLLQLPGDRWEQIERCDGGRLYFTKSSLFLSLSESTQTSTPLLILPVFPPSGYFFLNGKALLALSLNFPRAALVFIRSDNG